MNIGIIVDNEFNDDIRVRKEVDILQKNGYNINVLCFGFDNKEYPDIEGIQIERIKINTKTKNYLFFFFNRLPFYEILWRKRIKKFIIGNSIEVLHAHDLYMSKAAFLGIKSSKKNIKLILDLHENFPIAIQSYNWTKGFIRQLVSNPKAWLRKESKYLNYASKIIVLSKFFKKELISKYAFLKEENIIAFPNVIDLRRFESFDINYELPKSNRITLLYFGVVAERRGIFNTFDVLEKALKENLSIDLIIIGPVDKADKLLFDEKINDPDLINYIRHIPWIDISELTSYFNICDIFLSPLIKNPQHESGVANKIFQYMFGKKPIIVSDCKPQKELIETFNCGLVYSNQDEFLDCIKKLALDSELRTKLGENGFNELYNNYDDDTFASILLNIYKD